MMASYRLTLEADDDTVILFDTLDNVTTVTIGDADGDVAQVDYNRLRAAMRAFVETQ